MRPEGFGPEEFAAATGVSRETLARLKLYVGLLEDWNSRVNLVSSQSLTDVWRRHLWDCAQLYNFLPADTASLVDLGSGAGFPGLVLAILLRGQNVRVVLYEATGKKARFLEEVARRTDTPVEVRNVRIEQACPEPFDVITARACAPLAQLLSYAERFRDKRTRCLFLKGQSVGVELAEARKNWDINVRLHPSRTDTTGTVVEVLEFYHGCA